MKGERFQVIRQGELDNQTEMFKSQIVSQGDTIASSGGQYHEYLQIQNIGTATVSLKRYGFAKGLGRFDEVTEIEISKECIPNL